MATTVTSTIRSSGGDYTTLSAWEAAKQGDLVTADQVQVAECYDDWPSGLVDNVTIDGSTTDATRYLKITVAAGHRHTGIPQTGFFLKKSQAFGGILYNNDNYTLIEWVDAENTGTGDAFGLRGGGNTAVVWRQCLARAATGTSNFAALMPSGNSLYNCLAYGGGAGFNCPDFGAPTIYNSVAVNCTKGFSPGAAASMLLKNCIAYNNTTNYASTTYSASSTNNATSTGSDDAPGANSVYSITSANFVNAAGNNFHLSTGTNSLVGAGVNLYSTFTTDIDGDTWPSSGAWDIGFDYRTGGGAVFIARSPYCVKQAVNRAGTY